MSSVCHLFSLIKLSEIPHSLTIDIICCLRLVKHFILLNINTTDIVLFTFIIIYKTVLVETDSMHLVRSAREEFGLSIIVASSSLHLTINRNNNNNIVRVQQTLIIIVNSRTISETKVTQKP